MCVCVCVCGPSLACLSLFQTYALMYRYLFFHDIDLVLFPFCFPATSSNSMAQMRQQNGEVVLFEKRPSTGSTSNHNGKIYKPKGTITLEYFHENKLTDLSIIYIFRHFYRPQRRCGKVMFSRASVFLFTGEGVWQTPPLGRPLSLGRQPPPRADTPSPQQRLLQRTVRILLEMHSCII